MTTVAVKNQAKRLSFSERHLQVELVEEVEDYWITERTVVVNPSMKKVIIDHYPEKSIMPLSSTILTGIGIKSADSLVLVRVIEPENLGAIISKPGWQLYENIVTPEHVNHNNVTCTNRTSLPKDTPLWRSSQDNIGMVKFDPYFITGQSNASKEVKKFLVKVNLWFATANTDCFIHNTHNFIEVHTQIYGHGRMQKFKERDAGAIYEDIPMGEGYTTPTPFCSITDDYKLVYPWHRYYADTDCLWLAIEYHFDNNDDQS
jgi:hypothetical protein